MAAVAALQDQVLHHVWHLLCTLWNSADVHLWRRLVFPKLLVYYHPLEQRRDWILDATATFLVEGAKWDEKTKHVTFLSARLGGLGVSPPIPVAALQHLSARFQPIQAKRADFIAHDTEGRRITADVQTAAAVAPLPAGLACLGTSQAQWLCKCRMRHRTGDVCASVTPSPGPIWHPKGACCS